MAGFEGKDKFDWDEFWNSLGIIPTESMNQTLACTALNMLALCYLPGCIAAYIQLFRGTKYSRFPNFLDQWLKMRKYLGLLMLFSASMHVSLRFFLCVEFLCQKLFHKNVKFCNVQEISQQSLLQCIKIKLQSSRSFINPGFCLEI